MDDSGVVVCRLVLVVTAWGRGVGLGVEECGPVERSSEARDDGVTLGVSARGEGASGAGEDVACCGWGEGLVGRKFELVVDDVRVDDAEGGLGVDEDFGVGLGVAGVDGGDVGIVVGAEEGSVGLGGVW